MLYSNKIYLRDSRGYGDKISNLLLAKKSEERLLVVGKLCAISLSRLDICAWNMSANKKKIIFYTTREKL